MQEKKVYCTRRASRLIPMNQDKVIWINMKLLSIPFIWRIKDENANRQNTKIQIYTGLRHQEASRRDSMILDDLINWGRKTKRKQGRRKIRRQKYDEWD